MQHDQPSMPVSGAVVDLPLKRIKVTTAGPLDEPTELSVLGADIPEDQLEYLLQTYIVIEVENQDGIPLNLSFDMDSQSLVAVPVDSSKGLESDAQIGNVATPAFEQSKMTLAELAQRLQDDLLLCHTNFERSNCAAISGKGIRERAAEIAKDRTLTEAELAIASQHGYRQFAQRKFDELKAIGQSVMQAMAHDGFRYDDPIELGDEVMLRLLSLDLPKEDRGFIGNYIFAQYGHGGGLRCSQKPFKMFSELKLQQRNKLEGQE